MSPLKITAFKYIVLLIFVSLAVDLMAQSPANTYEGVQAKYHTLLQTALQDAGSNVTPLQHALNEMSPEMKDGMAFLIAYMPKHDLKDIDSELLIKNVKLAYQARNDFAWARQLPDSIFLNEVLPYAVIDEDREDWRSDFYQRFSKKVAGLEDAREAVSLINREIRDELLVDYSTKRSKANQNPSQSIAQGMASCTGLTILLVDAFRSVGIPARMAGVANWHDNRGSHNWCEVWLDGQWHFTEYYPSEALDRSWFLADAGKTTPYDKEYAVHASSFKPTDTHFPLVWDRQNKSVYAVDVTSRYIELYKTALHAQLSDEQFVNLNVMGYQSPLNQSPEARIKINVEVFSEKDQIGSGATAGPRQDANDFLTFTVEKNKTYILKYTTKHGVQEKQITVGDKDSQIKLFFETSDH